MFGTDGVCVPGMPANSLCTHAELAWEGLEPKTAAAQYFQAGGEDTDPDRVGYPVFQYHVLESLGVWQPSVLCSAREGTPISG